MITLATKDPRISRLNLSLDLCVLSLHAFGEEILGFLAGFLLMTSWARVFVMVLFFAAR